MHFSYIEVISVQCHVLCEYKVVLEKKAFIVAQDSFFLACFSIELLERWESYYKTVDNFVKC